MSQLNLPDTLQQELSVLAEYEGILLNQYILYALTRQVALAYRAWKLPESDIQFQQQAFSNLLEQLGKATSEQIQATLQQPTLQQRETVNPEPELANSTVQRLLERIK